MRGLISIHALREEGDVYLLQNSYKAMEFLSTPSARRATLVHAQLHAVVVFLSTPSARRATRRHQGRGLQEVISIHALREEGDTLGPQPCPSR